VSMATLETIARTRKLDRALDMGSLAIAREP
jgi:hypothetical protein